MIANQKVAGAQLTNGHAANTTCCATHIDTHLLWIDKQLIKMFLVTLSPLHPRAIGTNFPYKSLVRIVQKGKLRFGGES